MTGTRRFLTALRALFKPSRGQASGRDASRDTVRAGSDATVEVDPGRIRRVRTSYAPTFDGDPDPGEIVWTWVPFEERDGRGKDRPVVIVAAESGGTVLAVQLTSKDHMGEAGYVYLGVGSWDRAGRPSWVDTDRVFRVHAGGMRREAASVDAARYAHIITALRARYGWS